MKGSSTALPRHRADQQVNRKCENAKAFFDNQEEKGRMELHATVGEGFVAQLGGDGGKDRHQHQHDDSYRPVPFLLFSRKK